MTLKRFRLLKAVRTAGPVITTLLLAAGLHLLYFQNPQWFVDDGPVENLQVIMLVCAGGFMFHHYRKKLYPRFRMFFLLLSLSLFWVALEEISYFQRVLVFYNSDILNKLNRQDQFNIHNIVYFEEIMVDMLFLWVILSLWRKAGGLVKNRIPLFETSLALAMLLGLVHYHVFMFYVKMPYPH